MISSSTNRKPVLLALAASFLLTILIVVGSRNLEHYDAALFGYTIASVVAFGAMWPVLLATVHGFAAVEPRLTEVSRCLQMSRAAFVWKIGLPNAMPDILAGMRLSMTISLIVAVVGEMIASQSGLGQAILLAARAFRASELFAGIVLLGLIGFTSNALLAIAEKKLLRWQQP